MNRLLNVLQLLSVPPELGGERASAASPPTVDRARMAQARLGRLLERLDWMIKIVVTLLVVLFAVSMAAALGVMGSATSAGVAAAGLGLGASGCIWWLILLWRERTATMVILHVTQDLRGPLRDVVLQQLIMVMLGRLKQGYGRSDDARSDAEVGPAPAAPASPPSGG
jgi:hypothetical protein